MTGRPPFRTPIDRPLEIAFDARSLCGDRTGVGTYTANLIPGLLAVDPALNVLLIADQELPHAPWLDPESTRCVTTSFGARNNLLWSNLSLTRALLGQGADLFHSPGYTMPLAPLRPALVTLHDISYAAAPEWYPYHLDPLRRWWYRASAKRADGILTDSEFSRREILRVYGIDPERVFRVHLGVDSETFTRTVDPSILQGIRQKHRLAERYILHVGDVHRRRNLERALEAFHQLRNSDSKHQDLQFVLVGRIQQAGDALQTALRDEQASGVRGLGYVAQGDLSALYSAAAALLFPSLYEGFGFPVLEAMACGCPAIVGRGTSCEEIGGEAAVVIDPLDVAAMTRALGAILENGELAQHHSRVGLERAQQFTWRSTAKETLRVYHEVLQRRKPKGAGS